MIYILIHAMVLTQSRRLLFRSGELSILYSKVSRLTVVHLVVIQHVFKAVPHIALPHWLVLKYMVLL